MVEKTLDNLLDNAVKDIHYAERKIVKALLKMTGRDLARTQGGV